MTYRAATTRWCKRLGRKWDESILIARLSDVHQWRAYYASSTNFITGLTAHNSISPVLRLENGSSCCWVCVPNAVPNAFGKVLFWFGIILLVCHYIQLLGFVCSTVKMNRLSLSFSLSLLPFLSMLLLKRFLARVTKWLSSAADGNLRSSGERLFRTRKLVNKSRYSWDRYRVIRWISKKCRSHIGIYIYILLIYISIFISMSDDRLIEIPWIPGPRVECEKCVCGELRLQSRRLDMWLSVIVSACACNRAVSHLTTQAECYICEHVLFFFIWSLHH